MKHKAVSDWLAKTPEEKRKEFKVKPKQCIKLDKVTTIDHISPDDIKKFKKLKSKEVQDKYLKITFLKEGLIKGEPTKEDLDSGEEDDLNNDDEKAKDQSWFIMCPSKPVRDAIMTKIFMNIQNS